MSHPLPLRSSRSGLAADSITFRGRAIGLVVLGAVALTACGGGSNSPGTSTTAASGGTGAPAATTGAGARTNAAFAKYMTCLKQHGVAFRGPGAGGLPGGGAPGAGGTPPPGTTGGSGAPAGLPAGFDNATFQKAQAACAGLRPKGARGGGPGFGGGPNNAAFAAYRNCLQINGVTLADLRPGNGNAAAPSAKVKKAMAACAGLRPSRGAPPASTTTTPAQ